jgi:hypothetical protein
MLADLDEDTALQLKEYRQKVKKNLEKKSQVCKYYQKYKQMAKLPDYKEIFVVRLQILPAISLVK